MSRIPGLAIILVSFPLAALAQDAATPEQKSKEDWLRYSNWEHRATMPQKQAPGKSKAGLVPDSGAGTAASSAPALPLPENPGSQTVEGVQPTVPGWAFQPPTQVQRSAQLFLGGDSYMGPSSYLSRPGAFDFAPGRYPYYWGAGSPPSGFQPFSSAGSFGLRNYAGTGLPPGSERIPYFPARRSPLGAEVIETGPSPASGNYYQPGSIDPSASGNYYGSGAPWQVPLNMQSTPRDYWGPQGSPFNR